MTEVKTVFPQELNQDKNGLREQMKKMKIILAFFLK